MIKKIFIILVLFTIVLLPSSILKISSNNDSIKVNKVLKDIKIGSTPIKEIELAIFSEPSIGSLIIDKIKLNEELYDINSSNNTVDKHVSIMKESTYPDNSDSLMIIAAHSGRGKVAYFEKLDRLKINDQVKLIYKNKTYTYIVKDIWEEKKDGFINFNRESTKQLILTTCSPKHEGYQLVINSILKESN